MKKLKNKNLKIIFFFIVIIVLCIFIVLWFIEGTYPVDRNNSENVNFRISKGESIKQISTRLSQEGLIRSPTAFFLLVKYLKIERNLQAGEFNLNKSMSAKQISQELTHGKLDTWITIIEGWRVEEIATKMTKDFGIPEIEFISLAKEGYMFPDTYNIPQNASAGAIVNLFIQNFNSKITSEMLNELKNRNLSLNDAIILASIVEREAADDNDRPIIAGILLNRLKIGMPLQVDATIQYALGYQPDNKNWWKKQLTSEDKEVDSRFNTYKYIGLPPKPISNPGLASIKAVIYPVKTDYIFYLHDQNGKIHYARSLEEHNQNINKYL